MKEDLELRLYVIDRKDAEWVPIAILPATPLDYASAAVKNDLDTGFFEPFRNNIVKVENGVFTIRLTNPIIFDREVVIKYFSEAVVSYNNVIDKGHAFTCKPINAEIEKILLDMFYNPTIKL